jgi:hypothetical protein
MKKTLSAAVNSSIYMTIYSHVIDHINEFSRGVAYIPTRSSVEVIIRRAINNCIRDSVDTAVDSYVYFLLQSNK